MPLRSIFISAAAALASTAPASAANDIQSVAAFFHDAQIISGPTLVDCTLSAGTKTQCFEITVKAEPKAYTPGPWCPTSIDDDASAGGIWLQDGLVHDVDGTFIQNLNTFYEDSKWQLYDEETGKVRVTDTLESCDLAARPNVDEAYQNYCVQCLPEYMEEGSSVTYTIPVTPQPLDVPTDRLMAGAGLAWNGIRLDGPAPVDAILGAYTVAPFDDCGGHVNLHVGYHYHAATDCLVDQTKDHGHAAEIGIAMDGYKIMANTLIDGTAPSDLDACNGHATDADGYHYHAGAAGSNQILGCMTAEFGCSSEDPDQTCDASARRPRP